MLHCKLLCIFNKTWINITNKLWRKRNASFVHLKILFFSGAEVPWAMGHVGHKGGSVVGQYAHNQGFHVTCLEPCCFALLFREFYCISLCHDCSYNHQKGWKRSLGLPLRPWESRPLSSHIPFHHMPWHSPPAQAALLHPYLPCPGDSPAMICLLPSTCPFSIPFFLLLSPISFQPLFWGLIESLLEALLGGRGIQGSWAFLWEEI